MSQSTFTPRTTRVPHTKGVWPRIQVRLPEEMLSLLKLYSVLLGVPPTTVLRALWRDHSHSVFGPGRTVADVQADLDRLTPEAKVAFISGIQDKFAGLTRLGR